MWIFLLMLFASQGCAPVIMCGSGAGIAMVGSDPRHVRGVFSDHVLKAKIHRQLFKVSADVNIGLDVMVWEGRVLLTGHLRRQKLRTQAVSLVKTVQGVQEVFDHISVGVKATPFKYALDRMIKTKIKTKLLLTHKIKSNNYSVHAQDQIVYLMGLAVSQEEFETVVSIAQKTDGAAKVITYVRVMSEEEVAQQKYDKQ